jgi:hypothetical protein
VFQLFVHKLGRIGIMIMVYDYGIWLRVWVMIMITMELWL